MAAVQLCVYLPHIGCQDSYLTTNRGEAEWKSFPQHDVWFCSWSDLVHQNISSSPLVPFDLL